jgi:hypothetical protein
MSSLRQGGLRGLSRLARAAPSVNAATCGHSLALPTYNAQEERAQEPAHKFSSWHSSVVRSMLGLPTFSFRRSGLV